MIRDIVMTQSGNSTIPLTDINAANVSLLLNGDGTNGAQNNTFIDSSVNNATITRYGDTTQGSFSPFGNSWSNYFDGAGDYLTAPSSANFAFGTGDFTIECWALFNGATTAGQGLFHIASAYLPSIVNGVAVGSVNPGSAFGVYHSGTYTTGTIIPNKNEWYHIAVTRTGTTTRLFINGVANITVTDSTNYTQQSLTVGGWYSSSNLINGYISNLRILKGTALYTANFTPSTTPLTAITNTVLLTCQSNNFKDNSVNNAIITKYGDVKVEKDSPFPEVYDKAVHGGSAYFDGTGDWLLSNPLSSNALGAGDLTVECWVNVPTISGSYAAIVADNSYGAGSNGWAVYQNGAAIEVWQDVGNIHTISSALNVNTWIHIAWVRIGTSSKVYINGVASSLVSNSTAYSGTQYWVGARGPTSGSYPFTGYISNLRILKGTALYTSNFTPSSTPLTAIANTVLLLKGENAGIVDSASKNSLTTYGNAQISTTTKKFGTGSMYFDGTRPSRLKSDATASLAFGTSDFTIEMWCYQVSKASGYPRLINFNADYTTNTHALMMNTDDAVNLFRYAVPNNIGDAIMKSTTTLSSNTWYHAAVTRSGTTFRLYVNGVLEASYTSSATVDSNATSYITLGDTPTMTASEQFNGYIDDLRITKGIARYPLNIMPTQALPLPTATAAGDDPYWASVSLLLNGDGTNGSTVFTDLSSSPKAITTYGNAQVSTAQKKYGTGAMYFDGAGDYLTVPANNGCVFGTGDFTVEGWYNITSHGSMGTMLWNHNTAASGHPYMMVFGNKFAFGNTGNYPFVVGAITLSLNTWYHLALSRSSGSLRLFVNGVLDGTASVTTDYSTSNPIGIFTNLPCDNNWTGAGYADDVRITKGIARYTANFTPPTQSLPLSGGNPLDPYSAHVSLLLNGDGANGSTTFTDLSLSPTTVTAYGNAQISTAQKKYGTGSLYFDGAGDYLEIPNNPAFSFGTGDFTVEYWMYYTSASTTYGHCILDTRDSNGNATGIAFSTMNNGAAEIYTSVENSNAGTATINTWNHYAFVRSAGILTSYINGVSVVSIALAQNFTDTTCVIGSNEPRNTHAAGYIDDLRITKGVARYTANFTPPTQSLSL